MLTALFALLLAPLAKFSKTTKEKWSYLPKLLRPFWEGDTVEGESVLFIPDEKTGEARASVLFRIRTVQNTASAAQTAWPSRLQRE